MLVMASSECPEVAAGLGLGAGVAGWGVGAGVEARVWPAPGKGGAAAELGVAVEEVEAMGAEGGGVGLPCLRKEVVSVAVSQRVWRRGALVNLLVVALEVLRKLVFGQEADLSSSDHERVLCEVDAGLVALEHVESKEEVDVLALR